jgi:two-component system sensor histidine kinase/response regulator
MISTKAAEKNIELINNIESDVPYFLVGDPLRVGQILLNLVNNAVKFTNQGHVLVEAKLVRKAAGRCQIRFSVSDTGIGLTKEQREKLFSAFSQADSSVTRRFGGTGLGLTISKRLVEMMNGTISVESEFGVGSTFSFEIEFQIQRGEKEIQPVFKRSLQNLKVLIVDDNEVSREILKEQIGAFGVDAVAVASGKAAIEEVKNQSKRKPFDLVIMDWRMPEMDGIEAAKTILNDNSIDHVPMAIMVSAFGREEVARKAEKIGINSFLMKPINQSLLFDTIVNMFGMDKSGMTIQDATIEGEREAEIRIDGMKILLVEDNAINQEVATEILSSAGARVEIANNGKEAVEAIAAYAYDLVLMDLQMPVMGGYEATKFIRAERKNQDLPIIAMTAHAMQGVEAECKAAGMNDYVSKPINPKNLFNTILKWAKPVAGAADRNTETPSPEDAGTKTEVDFTRNLPGIDLQEGIARVNGNAKLFQRLLKSFIQDYTADVDSIKRAISAHDVQEAGRLAHTLKGVSANLSVKEISGIAAQLETMLKEGATGNFDRLLTQLDEAFFAVRDGLETFDIEEQTNPAQETTAKEYAEEEPILREIARLIWEDNIDAEQALDELKKVFENRFAEEIREIEKNIDEFDFEAAKEPLRKIATELNIRLDGTNNERSV